jgi:hypothetical protein
MVVLQFRAEKDQDWDDDAVLKYEQAIADYYTRWELLLKLKIFKI